MDDKEEVVVEENASLASSTSEETKSTTVSDTESTGDTSTPATGTSTQATDTGTNAGGSPKERYEVSDYGIFDDASVTVNDLNNNLKDCQDAVQTIKEILQNKDVFDGPIADTCSEALNKEHEKFDVTMSNFSLIDSYLSESLSNYQEGDLSAQTKILQTGDNGRLFTGVAPATEVGNSEKEIFNRFVSELQKNGMDSASAKVAAASMMGNAYRETGHTYDPSLVSDSGTSYGIFQWRNGTAADDKRWDEVVAWCSANGYDASTLAGQIAYSCYDVTKGKYYYVGNHFANSEKSADGVSEQTEMFLKKYEGAKREDVAKLNPQFDYDAMYLEPAVKKSLELYASYGGTTL